MATNAFDCKKCGHMTKHYSISMREYNAITTGKTGIFAFDAACAMADAFGDAIGITKGYKIVTGRQFWKCCECGTATERSAGGEVVD